MEWAGGKRPLPAPATALPQSTVLAAIPIANRNVPPRSDGEIPEGTISFRLTYDGHNRSLALVSPETDYRYDLVGGTPTSQTNDSLDVPTGVAAAIVPEPASCVVWGFGAFGIIWWRRRRI